jgi:hypothetical protein
MEYIVILIVVEGNEQGYTSSDIQLEAQWKGRHHQTQYKLQMER